jgi:acyl-CoA thioester hydrolase
MPPLQLRVIYGDTDQMGVVYYANYLRYFEAARGHFIRARGSSYLDVEAAGYHLPVIEAQVSYKQSLRYDDLFTVEAVVAERKKVRVKFAYRIVRGETLVAEGYTWHACIDKHGRPSPMPPEMIRFLDAPEVV